MSKYAWNPKPDHQFNRIFTVNIRVCPTYKMASRTPKGRIHLQQNRNIPWMGNINENKTLFRRSFCFNSMKNTKLVDRFLTGGNQSKNSINEPIESNRTSMTIGFWLPKSIEHQRQSEKMWKFNWFFIVFNCIWLLIISFFTITYISLFFYFLFLFFKF